MLKIWGRASSSNVMKLLWLCEELGIPYQRLDAGGSFGRTREPAYLKKLSGTIGAEPAIAAAMLP
jgi:glutathione S-transferase